MAKDKHHYVPRFYLQVFACAPRRIHVYHLRSKRSILSVGLRDQCYRKKLYGKKDTVEDELMRIEQRVAPIIKQVIKDSRLPSYGSESHALLLFFIALQSARTPKAGSELKEGVDHLVSSILDEHPNTEESVLAPLRIKVEKVIMYLLQGARSIVQCMSDLSFRLVYNPTDLGFVTSDNPVVKYNRYCEGIKGLTTAAPAKIGFQMFLPLSPQHLLLLYDNDVYKIAAKRYTGTLLASLSDVRKLNLLQAIFAENVVLFSTEKDLDSITSIVESATELRMQNISRIETFVAEDDPHRELVHMFREPVNANLRLSFLGLRSKASKKPLKERAIGHREQAMKVLDPYGEREFLSREKRIFRHRD